MRRDGIWMEGIRRKETMKRRKDYGHGSRRLCRVLLAGFSVLFLALLPLGAWPMLQGGAGEELKHMETIIAMTAEPTVEEQSQNRPSGEASVTISEEQSNSLERAQEGKRLSGDEALELYLILAEAADEARTAESISEAKSAEISELKARLAKAEDETGTKAYMILDGLVGFDAGCPDYGVGLTIGTRIGNSMMIELGADYMLGDSLDDIVDFSLDDWTFRAGVGWMF